MKFLTKNKGSSRNLVGLTELERAMAKHMVPQLQQVAHPMEVQSVQ